MTEAFQRLHGHSRGVIVTDSPAPGVSRLTLSSAARLLIDSVPTADALKVYVQFSRPLAGCHEAPPSTVTSTPPTRPPPESVAVPETVIGPTCALEPFVGLVIVELGAVVSVDAVVAVSSGCNVDGWTPMSANRFTVACCIRTSVSAPGRS